MKCEPLNFRGIEGVVGLSRWFEKMESVFHISCCGIENQVMFPTCPLLDDALTWWNGYLRTLGHEAAYAMTWETLKKKMSDKYCPRGEIKKLEIKLWNLKKVDKYIGGLSDNIHRNVMSARPKTLDEAIELANDLMDQKLHTYAERQTESKRKFDNNNQAQQLPKRQNVAQAYAVGTGERKEYAGTLLLCNKCKFHHNGPCTTKCANCKKVSHLIRDCWNPTATSNQKTITFYGCKNQGHYNSDCPELKNQNHGNQAECTKARGMVTNEKIVQIKSRIQAARDRKKSYTDLKHKTMDFQVGDRVMLKVVPWKKDVQYGKREKLNPTKAGPFKVLSKVSDVAYRLERPQQLSRVHNTFRVSNLKKCLSDESLVISLDELHVDDERHFVEEPVEIMDLEIKQLKKSHIPIIKVRWNSKRGPKFTWGREDQFKKTYPHLFTKTVSSSSN
nr:putative reverse transcriptase domain-containing protein [Tanacetum cinerariifolium]